MSRPQHGSKPTREERWQQRLAGVREAARAGAERDRRRAAEREAALVARLTPDQREALSPWAEETLPLATRLARHITGDWTIADEIVQEAYLRMLRHSNQYDLPQGGAALALGFVRRTPRRTAHHGPPAPVSLYDYEGPGGRPLGERVADRRAPRPDLEACLGELWERLRLHLGGLCAGRVEALRTFVRQHIDAEGALRLVRDEEGLKALARIAGRERVYDDDRPGLDALGDPREVPPDVPGGPPPEGCDGESLQRHYAAQDAVAAVEFDHRNVPEPPRRMSKQLTESLRRHGMKV